MVIYNMNIIIDTHGDLLGIFLFLALIIYFIQLKDKTIYTNLLLTGSVIGLIVDTNIVINYIKKN